MHQNGNIVMLVCPFIHLEINGSRNIAGLVMIQKIQMPLCFNHNERFGISVAFSLNFRLS